MSFRDITEREAAEAAETGRLVAAQAVAKMGSWETDRSTALVIWSLEMHRIFETSPDTFQPTHQRFLAAVHPDDRAAVDAAFVRSSGLPGTQTIEHRLLLPDGRVKFVEQRWRSVSDDRGRPLRVIGTCQDISDRKRADGETRPAGEALAGSVAVLQEIATANLSLQDAMTLMATRAQALTSATGGVIELVEGQDMVYRAASGAAAVRVGMRLARSGSLSGLAVESGTALVSEDTETDDRVNRVACRKLGVRSMVVAPLRDGQQIIGVLKVTSGQPAAFAQRDMTNLQILVESLGAVIQRKQAEEAAERSHQRWRALIDGLGPSMFVGLMTPEGQLIEANRAALAAAGLTLEDVLGKPFEDTYWWAYSPEVQQQLREAIARAAHGEASRYDVQLRVAEQQLIDVDFSLQPLRDETGEVVFLVPSASVITERKQTENALRESNENFHLLADNIIDAFWIRSPDMREVHYISPAFERIWGRPAGPLYANPAKWADFIFPEDRERVMGVFAALTGDAPSVDVEYRIVRPDGEIRWVRVRGFQVRDAADTLIRLTGIVTDITEKRRLEYQFLRAQRMESIGTLAGGIAHDLNNVLAAILLSVEMLKDLAKNAEDLALLELLEGSAQRGADLVKQVLSFARGVEGKRITVNPVHLMRDLLALMRDTFPKSINVCFTPAPDLWTVTGDPTQMHQVFLNLCVNARDAMPDGGNLTVIMANVVLDETFAATNPDSRPGTYVMVQVEDTGTGIPPEIREKIFEPFFTTKEIGKGTGLGLSTTLAIVNSHAGFIQLHCEVGKGTTFQVYLPANTTEAAVDAVAVEHRLPHGNGELILVVDDEEAIRKITRRTLERFGYRVLLAVNGAEALAMYAQHRSEIALVLTDMAMPVMGGPATIIALKAMNPAVKIIGTSGFASGGGIDEAVSAGLEHFVPKPYTIDTMLKTLHEILSGQGSREQE